MKYAVLLSGGVDSSVALNLLVEQGHKPTAFYLKIWLEDELAYLGSCPWQEDLHYAQAVCDQLSVPLHIVSLQRAYWDRVVSYTLAEVTAGRTPNPDILCNQRVKFGAFYETPLAAEFDKVVTGHYAGVRSTSQGYELICAADSFKDQTYFLSFLNQAQLSKACFPLATYTKPEIRALARQCNLPTKDRKDSQGICFLGKLNFNDFLKHHLGTQTGDLIEYETSTKVGTHEGFWFYTTGQRKGIGLSGGPWYVVHKDTATNKVFVSKAYYQDKMRTAFRIEPPVWILHRPDSSKPLRVKLRHGQDFQECTLAHSAEGYTVTLQHNDQGIAPGQFAVFYQDEVCLGAGVII